MSRFPTEHYFLERPARPIYWLAFDDRQPLQELSCPAISRCHPGTAFYCATIETWPTIVAVNQKQHLAPVILEEPFQTEPTSFFIRFFYSMQATDEQSRSQVADELAGLVQITHHCTKHILTDKKETIPPPPLPGKRNCIPHEELHVYYFDIFNGSRCEFQVRVRFGKNTLSNLSVRGANIQW